MHCEEVLAFVHQNVVRDCNLSPSQVRGDERETFGKAERVPRAELAGRNGHPHSITPSAVECEAASRAAHPVALAP